MQLYRIGRFLIITLIIVSFFVIGHHTGILKPFESVITYITRPLHGFVFRVGTFISGEYKTIDQLSQENSELNTKLGEFTVNSALIQSLQDENADLKELLDFKDQSNSDIQVANVIGKSSDGFKNTRIINQGENNGIQEGYAVISGTGIIIGKIIDTTAYTSTLLLLSDNTSKIAATIQNSDKTIGVVNGNYNISMNMELIPQNESILVGDLVVTSGLETHIPKGLLIGEVDDVSFDSADLFQKAIIKPLVNYNKLDIVSVVIPTENNNEEI